MKVTQQLFFSILIFTLSIMQQCLSADLTFSLQQSTPSYSDTRAAIGDMDADGDADIFLTNSRSSPNHVLLQDASGLFNINQNMGAYVSESVKLGDLNGNGHLDAFVSNYKGSSEIWFNDGSGNFTANGISFGGGN